jgi:release factor glutamine methyltransferase
VLKIRSNTIKQFIKIYFDKNHKSLDVDYPGIRFERFLDEYCEYDNSSPDDNFFMDNPGFFQKIKLGVPLEYINFKSYFYKSDFYVNKDVLIPRNETEILVEDAINYINQNYHDDFSIYDIGTGCGIIPLTIATEVKKSLNIFACDISKEALAVAKINVDHLMDQFAKGTTVEFEIRDRLFELNKQFDLITSNPPYIKEVEDKSQVHHATDIHEPHMALYLKDDEYDHWFATLFTQVRDCLKPNGFFLMEGHEDHLENQALMAKPFFSCVEIKKDYTQRNRFLHCQK